MFRDAVAIARDAQRLAILAILLALSAAGMAGAVAALDRANTLVCHVPEV